MSQPDVRYCLGSRWLSLLIAPTHLLYASWVCAEESQTEPPIYLGAGVSPLVLLGEVCEHGGDVIACTEGIAGLAAELSGHVVISPPFQVGARVALGLEAGGVRSKVTSDGFQTTETRMTRRLGLFSVEGRYEPDDDGGPWLGAEAGAGAIQEVFEETGSGADRTHTATHWAPLVGLQVGYGFALEESIFFGTGLRLGYLHFAESDADVEEGTTTYGHVYLAALILDFRFGL